MASPLAVNVQGRRFGRSQVMGIGGQTLFATLNDHISLRDLLTVPTDTPTITGVSGTLSHGSTLTIDGSGFGSHADYGGAQAFRCRGFNDFSSSLNAGNWAQDGQDAANCTLSTSSPLGGAASQFYRKEHIVGNQGSVECIHSSPTGVYRTTFYYRESSNSPVIGSNACTKLWRRYLGPEQGEGAYNWYLGPEFENFTNFVTPPATLNRYSQYPTAPYFPQNTWRWHEIIEHLGNVTGDGTAVWGSPDFLTIRLNNAELIRRGTGLPSNPQPGQGTDANDNQQWVGDPPEGQSGGVTKLGSHLCETAGGYYMDFADAFINYTLATVRIGSQSTYAANTGFFEQPALAWSGTQIQVQLNRGNLTLAGSYLYVINENNQISPGFLLS